MTISTNRLKELRKIKGVFQKDVAKILNIQEKTYRVYEAGSIDPPTSKSILLAKYFDVSLDYLVGLSDDPKRR